jgi:O-antigen/teichoic acid export membrane protein
VTRPTAVIARHTVAYASGSIVGGVTRAVLLPVIARKLSTEEYGVFSLLFAATNLLHLVFELGLVTALIRFHHEEKDAAGRERLRQAVFLAMPVLDLALAAPLLLARDGVSRVLFGTPAHGVLVSIAIGTAFFGAQFQLFLGHLRARDRSRDFALLMALKGAISLSVTLVLVFVHELGIPGFLLGNLAGPAAVALIAIPRLLSRAPRGAAGVRAVVAPLLRFGVPLVPSAIGLWALTHLDAYLLRVLADLRSVGVYSFGSEICLPIALLLTSFQLAWPSFAFARARADGGAAELASVFRHLFVALVGGALAVCVLRREVIAIVGTETFADSAAVIPLLALATCLYGASAVFGTGLQVAGDTRRLPALVLAAAGANAGLNFVLIPLYRETGAALATAITNLVLSALVLRESNRQFPIPFELGKLARILAAAAVVLLAAEAFGELPAWKGIPLRLATLLLYPLALVPARAISAGELRAVPGAFREIARGR